MGTERSGAGIAHAGSDGGFNLTILPDQLDAGDPGFSLQYDPCTEGDLVEFTILETNATTSSTCTDGAALATLDTPSQHGTYTVRPEAPPRRAARAAGRNHLSRSDLLRTFRANPSKGWTTDPDTSDRDSSVLRFIDRAVDIHDLGDDVRLMLRECIDPLATAEPYEHLPKI